MVSSLRQVPKPGYGLALASRSQTFSTSASAHGVPVSFLLSSQFSNSKICFRSWMNFRVSICSEDHFLLVFVVNAKIVLHEF